MPFVDWDKCGRGMDKKMEALKKLEEHGFKVDELILEKKYVEKLREEANQVADNNWAHVKSVEMLVHYPRNAKQGNAYEQDQTVNPGWLNFHNVKDLIARFFVTTHAHHGKVNNWRDLCVGITSIDHEGGHLPMFDYDGKNIKTRVKKDIKQLQKTFGLGDATIYETRRGLHVYFFSDLVEGELYKDMLDSVECCKGFKFSFERNSYSVLRISAKYSEFDILPYRVVVSSNRGRGRPGRKAALIQEFLRLGQECGTHFASMYPQWGRYQEDVSPWKPASKKKPMKRVKKISKADYLKKKAYMQAKNEQQAQMQKMVIGNGANNWVTSTSTETSFTINTGTYTYK
jgi:hypothetical protein